MSNSTGGNNMLVLIETERKRLEAVWELFQSETVFLIDHLMVLKHVRIISNLWPFKFYLFNLQLELVGCCKWTDLSKKPCWAGCLILNDP